MVFVSSYFRQFPKSVHAHTSECGRGTHAKAEVTVHGFETQGLTHKSAAKRTRTWKATLLEILNSQWNPREALVKVEEELSSKSI